MYYNMEGSWFSLIAAAVVTAVMVCVAQWLARKEARAAKAQIAPMPQADDLLVRTIRKAS